MSLLPSSYAVDATRYRVSARLTGRSPRREDAIENALKAKLQARAAQRRAQEMMARQAAKELEEFTNEFKNAARHCFELIDVDKGGSLSKEEIVNAVHPKTGIDVRENGVLQPRALQLVRTPRNCCFRVFGVWWCGIIQRPLHTSFPLAGSN